MNIIANTSLCTHRSRPLAFCADESSPTRDYNGKVRDVRSCKALDKARCV